MTHRILDRDPGPAADHTGLRQLAPDLTALTAAPVLVPNVLSR